MQMPVVLMGSTTQTTTGAGEDGGME